MEIWHLKHNGVTTLTFWGHVVISHMTIRLAVGDFQYVVHGDHASIWHRYGDMAPQIIGLTDVDMERKMEEGIEKEEGGGERKEKGKLKRKKKGKGKEKRNGR